MSSDLLKDVRLPRDREKPHNKGRPSRRKRTSKLNKKPSSFFNRSATKKNKSGARRVAINGHVSAFSRFVGPHLREISYLLILFVLIAGASYLILDKRSLDLPSFAQHTPSENKVPVTVEIKGDQQGSSANMGAEAYAPKLQAIDLANALIFPSGMNAYPSQMYIQNDQYEGTVDLNYTLDPDLQTQLVTWLERYNSDYTAVAVIDVKTGEIISLASHVSDGATINNMATNAIYPAASVFKIVTAASAMDLGLLNVDSVIPFNGKSTTLYKDQVFNHKDNQWTRYPSLQNAFAKSVNPVFGRIGARVVGPERLQVYASRFGFNKRFNTDIAIAPSVMRLDPSDEWTAVEAGSGYTQNTTLSPLHGAMIAAAVANGGEMMLPHWIREAKSPEGESLYSSKPISLGQVISTTTANKMRTLMQETQKTGTARRSFSKYLSQKSHSGLEVGGKTGTLSGGGLDGLNDWFVGYAKMGDRAIAFGILNVSEEKWQIKSHTLAQKLIDYYFMQDNNSSN